MKRIKVYVMDLLCMSPYHDWYFCEALRQENLEPTLGSISFHLDKDCYRRYGMSNDPGLLDIVARIRICNRTLRRGLKFLECGINLIALSVRFLFSKPDVIHIQWLPLVTKVPIEMWFLRLAKKRGIKLVYSVHNLLPHDTGTRYRQKFKRVYGFMDALICHTEEGRSKLIKDFEQDPQRISLIPPGPTFHEGSNRSPAAARDRLGLNPADTVALFFGGISPYKGIDFLLDSWAVVRRRCSNAMLVIAGRAEDPIILETIRNKVDQLELYDSVRLDFGFVPPDLLTAYFQAADILVYPYSAITYSGMLQTGLSFGKAILATALPGFMETIKHEKSALLVPYGDVLGFSSALVRLIENSDDRARLGQGAAASFRPAVSWRFAARKSAKLYDAVLDNKAAIEASSIPSRRFQRSCNS